MCLIQSTRIWWDACLSGTEGIGLAWATMLGFVRITTNRRVVARPLPVQTIMEQLQAWLALPHVHIAQPSNTHFARLRADSSILGPPATITTDAHLAVLAMERRYILYSLVYFIFGRYGFCPI